MNFENFKKYLEENGIKVNGDILCALEAYHKWMQENPFVIDEKAVCKAMKTAVKEKYLRTGNMNFTY